MEKARGNLEKPLKEARGCRTWWIIPFIKSYEPGYAQRDILQYQKNN